MYVFLGDLMGYTNINYMFWSGTQRQHAFSKYVFIWNSENCYKNLLLAFFLHRYPQQHPRKQTILDFITNTVSCSTGVIVYFYLCFYHFLMWLFFIAFYVLFLFLGTLLLLWSCQTCSFLSVAHLSSFLCSVCAHRFFSYRSITFLFVFWFCSLCDRCVIGLFPWVSVSYSSSAVQRSHQSTLQFSMSLIIPPCFFLPPI